MPTTGLCRLCAENTKHYIDIFDEDGVKKAIGVKASSCLNINVHQNDVLPKIMCVACCDRLDNLYEFIEKSTKVQLILRALYQSSRLISVVTAEHDYAVKVPENLFNAEYMPGSPNRIDHHHHRDRSKLRNFYDENNARRFEEATDLENPSSMAMLPEEERSKDFYRETEHNYFLPSRESCDRRNRIRLDREADHNYYVRSDRCPREDKNGTDFIREIEPTDDIQDPTGPHVFQEYPSSRNTRENLILHRPFDK